MAVIEATAETFDELIKTEYAVVDFYGDHCGACAYTAPFFREAADDMGLIRFIKVNTTAYPEFTKRFDISGIPTFLYFRNGEQVHRSEGGMERSGINENLARMMYE
jgi:thioredoxin 1